MEQARGSVLQAPGAAPSRLTLITVPSPFLGDRTVEQVLPGRSLADLARGLAFRDPLSLTCIVNDRIVPEAEWASTFPEAGDLVILRGLPRAGIKDLATSYFKVLAGAFQFTYGGVYNAIKGIREFGVRNVQDGLAGFRPPPIPEFGGRMRRSRSTVDGAQNDLRPYEPTPAVIGQVRVWPPMAAKPYTEVDGKKQYLNMLFDVGYGPLRIWDLRIGNTTIRQTTEASPETAGDHESGTFKNLKYQIRLGYADDTSIGLFPASVDEDTMSVRLDHGEDVGDFTAEQGWYTRFTGPDAEAISVDVTFPRGLVNFTGDGKAKLRVKFEIRYRLAGTSTWTYRPILDVEKKEVEPVVVSDRWPSTVGTKLTKGRYEVQMRRLTKDHAAGTKPSQSYWTVLRTIQFVEPVNMKGRCLVAMRVQATDQLNGVIDEFNCMAQALLPDYNGSSWAAWANPADSPSTQRTAQNSYTATRNAATAYRAAFQGPWVARPLPDSRLDLTELALLHAEKFTYDDYWEDEATIYERAVDVALVTRSTFSQKNGKFTVVRDRTRTTPVQWFTPRNSHDFKAQRVYPDTPHALILEYVDPAREWQTTERVVLDDGYTEATASRFERVKTRGMLDPAHVFKVGRYMLAVMRLRPEVYELVVDMEHLIANRGDLVRVTHDAPLFGLGWGRIKSLGMSGSSVATITLDNDVTGDGVSTFVVRMRKADGTEILRTLTGFSGDTRTLTFAVAIPNSEPQPAVGDLVLFGKNNSESAAMLIASIRPAGDLSARLTLVDYSPAIFTAVDSTALIGAFNPQITTPPKNNAPKPTAPSLIVKTDTKGDGGIPFGASVNASADGTFKPAIVLKVTPRPSTVNNG